MSEQIDDFAQQHPDIDRTLNILQKIASPMRISSLYDYVKDEIHVYVSDSSAKEGQEETNDPRVLQWHPIVPSQQTLEFMAHKEEVVRQICSVFAITPQELGTVGNPSVEEWETARRDTARYLKRAIISVLRERRAQSHENTENTNQD